MESDKARPQAPPANSLSAAIAHYEQQLGDPDHHERLGKLAENDSELSELLRGASVGPKWARLISCSRLVERGYLKLFEPPEPAAPRKLKVVGEMPPLSQGNPRPAAVKSRPIYRRASTVVAEEQRWLHPGRFPLGTVSLIAGNMGVGKSTFISHMVATVTRGWAWPDGLNPLGPRSVIYIQDEESLAKTQRPRLERFGADLDKVVYLTAVQRGTSDAELGFSIARDVDALDVLCDKIGDVALVLIDPLGSFLGGVTGYKEGETREALDPLFRFAERRETCVTAVAHLNKDADKPIEHRISGTFALPAKARMVWYLSQDPANKSRRLLSLLKGNLDGKADTALAFSYPSGRLVWHPKPIRLDAHQVDNLLRQKAQDERLGMRMGFAQAAKASKLPAAKAVILSLLDRGPQASAELYRRAVDCGLTESTYRKALAALRDTDRKVVEEGDPAIVRLAPAAPEGELAEPARASAEALALAAWEDDGGAASPPEV